MASVFKQIQSRQIQKRANNFIQSLENKSLKYIEQAYLDNKELAHNEIVLSYLFFKHPELIKILPVKFQKSRLNSNVNMFKYGSTEAKKLLVSSWLKDNKFFMNANVIKFDNEEFNSYIRLYFNQPDDVAILYMDDLKRVIEILANTDLKETERLIDKIKDKLSDKQWDYIIPVSPIFIKYAPQNIQSKYAVSEEYVNYISGDARNEYIDKQINLIREDINLLNNVSIDVKREYIKRFPYMINYIDEDSLIDILKYDIDLIKYVNILNLKNEIDQTQEVIYGILDNIENKSDKQIINILISKGILNAKGKLYRYDLNSNNTTYQYTKRMISIIQKLSPYQMCSLIGIDVNYVLPYVAPIYNDNATREEKESTIIDCNSRCLTLFKTYYDDEAYSAFYKVINKIYNEYLDNIDKYDYTKDYDSILELLKILFNKQIMTNNNPQKIMVFIGMSLLYKSGTKEKSRKGIINLLNEIISTGYNKQIENDKEIYEINSLEIFDERLSFISKNLLIDFSNYNFTNMSGLLFLTKSEKIRKLFETYYNIIKNIYGENKESLYKSIESFYYNYDLLKDVENKELTGLERDNLIEIISSYINPCNIKKMEELSSYDITLLKKTIGELSAVKDLDVYKNILCNYLFNKGYNEKGNTGYLETSTIKELIEIFDDDTLKTIVVGGNRVFSDEEVDLFLMIKLLFNTEEVDLLLSYMENFINNKVNRNIISVLELFNKIKKYKVELINNQIVSLNEIEVLYKTRPTVVKKREDDNIVIYTTINQEFKVLCAEKNDGIHYYCKNVTELEKNCYGYNKLVSSGSIRFSTKDGHTIIKCNKDRKEKNEVYPEFIVVVGKLTDDIVSIAKENNLNIVEIQND